MENSSQPKSSLGVSIAIVIAGALIAVALFFSRGSGSTATNTNTAQNTGGQQTADSVMAIRTINTDDHQLGNPAAPLAVVVYTDLECPFCKAFHTTMHQVADAYGKSGNVLWVYRSFPLPQLHPKAPNEAQAAECVNELGGVGLFWKYVDKIFEVTPSNNGLDPAQLPLIATSLGVDEKQFTTCLSSNKYADRIQKDYDEAVAAGGRGTPFSIFVSSKPISDKAHNVVQALNDSFLSQAPNQDPPFVFSTDKHRISMSGALPYEIVKQVIDVLLASN